ncbi:MAG: hypothetical protein DME65_10505 [Verrucomicrobia bacterium]|nr:MAG: hypothetical protein DME65_10505 [Verrucomicrobiota bacterium]
MPGWGPRPAAKRSENPGPEAKKLHQPVKEGGSMIVFAPPLTFGIVATIARFRGLGINFTRFPGACAPGFMLTPASAG